MTEYNDGWRRCENCDDSYTWDGDPAEVCSASLCENCTRLVQRVARYLSEDVGCRDLIQAYDERIESLKNGRWWNET
jgi:hypothetical protein